MMWIVIDLSILRKCATFLAMLAAWLYEGQWEVGRRWIEDSR